MWETACFFSKTLFKSKLDKQLLIVTWVCMNLSRWWRWNKQSFDVLSSAIYLRPDDCKLYCNDTALDSFLKRPAEMCKA